MLFALPLPASTVSRIGDDFVFASKNVLTWKTAAIFGTGVALTAASTTLDATAFKNFTHQHEGAWVDVGNFWGTPFPAIGLFGVSLFMPDTPEAAKFRRFGETLAAAAVTSTLLSGILKYSIARTRPSGTNNLSLPSGHSTMAFTTAAVLQQYYGWWVGGPAYALSVLTAFARVEEGAHWVSDTVLGATIGIGIAELFRHVDESSVTVLPYRIEDPETHAAGYGLRAHVPL